MPRIIYGNPVTEAEPIQTFRQKYPPKVGLVTIDSDLVREVTASPVFIRALVESAQRLTLSDELVAAGKSYGVGWALTASESLGEDGGFETVRLRYIKRNVSPLEYGNPAALSIDLTSTSGVVRWHGVGVLTYSAANAAEGFQLVQGPNAAGEYFDRPLDISPGNVKTSPVLTFNLTLGGEVVATATEALALRVRRSATGAEARPPRLEYASPRSYETKAEALAAGNTYLPTFRQEASARASEAAEMLANGTPVVGYTEIGSAFYDSVTAEGLTQDTTSGPVEVGPWRFIVSVPCNLYQLRTLNDLINEPGSVYPSRPQWTVENDVATCTIGGGVLLQVPPDESDSGGAS